MIPERALFSRACQWCGKNTMWYCLGCRNADDCGAASGHYCLGNGAECWGLNHRKRARTKREEAAEAEEEEEVDSEDEEDEENDVQWQEEE